MTWPLRIPNAEGDDESLRQELIMLHRDDGRRIARSFLKVWGRTADRDELYSLVDLALCEAAASYCPSFQTKFTTHCYYFIKNKLLRLFSPNFSVSLDEESSPGLHPALSFGAEELSTENAIASNQHQLRPDTVFLRKQLVWLGTSSWAQLSSLEELVVRKVYFDHMSVRDLAAELGYSREHVSRIRQRAIVRLRQFVELFETGKITANGVTRNR